ncbi:MAG TPA: hypothetical protein VK694_03935 [Verrucomicrobiae bacterium]|nr:hypothetical protein [Verrucomicrobiae bacterium]
MRIKVTDQLTDYEDRKLVEGTEPVTYRRVFVTALNAFEDKDRPAPDVMAQIYALSTRLYGANEVDLTLEEASLIKERVGKVYNPLVYGRTCDLLEGTTSKKR